MKHTFGPVPSRRLGQSLGVDPIPLKTCNWNCVYCQLGRSVPLSHERKAYFPLQDILTDVETALSRHAQEAMDWITIVGSGEPTLYDPLAGLVNGIRAQTDLPLAVITNGSTLYLPAVREALLTTDLVMPSLDAGTAALYKQINRPHPEASFARLIEGLIAFRKNYTGSIWLEVMLVAGLNDTAEALEAIAERIHEIKPDKVHLNLPTRPPAETWVHPSDSEGMQRAVKILGGAAEVVAPAEGEFSLDPDADLEENVLAIVMRHPMSEDDVLRTLHERGQGLDDILHRLEGSSRLQVIERHGKRFWTAKPSHYAEKK